MPTDIRDLVPLSEWIWGTLTLHFTRGSTVTRRMTLADAKDVQRMLNKKRSSDHLAWSDLCWIGFKSKKVVASEFDTDENYGWDLTRDDRAILDDNGHPHGILHQHWQDKGTEPSYTPRAMAHLHQAALDGVTAEEFATLADFLEGEGSEKRLQRAIDRANAAEARKRRAPDSAVGDSLVADDASEPDDAEPSDAMVADAGAADMPVEGSTGDTPGTSTGSP